MEVFMKHNKMDKAEKLRLILREKFAGGSVSAACKEYGVSRSTFYRWEREHSSGEIVFSPEEDNIQKTLQLQSERIAELEQELSFKSDRIAALERQLETAQSVSLWAVILRTVRSIF
jgi:transposase-like protein